jgi:hypothetical protein
MILVVLAFLGWMLDAFDFFSVGLTTTYIGNLSRSLFAL